MVYRGKPSAGCENCRKAKKRCDLEQPACSRCVKLKKVCTGYRDTTSLQIQDETISVKRKADLSQAKSQGVSRSQTPQIKPTSNLLAPPKTAFDCSIRTPMSLNKESSASKEDTLDIVPTLFNLEFSGIHPQYTLETMPGVGAYGLATLTIALQPKPDDIASNHFFESFTSNNHWAFMRTFVSQRMLDPCLEYAMKACGMAALDNVQYIPLGREYAHSMYGEALRLLNDALRDPKRCKTDEALIAVAMLGYYENLTCDGLGSIQSWKAHVKGATQLLKIRGKSQFKTNIGRILFRETRNQIMVHSIWDDERPPDFLWEYQGELMKYSAENDITVHIDELTSIIFDFAALRANIRYKTISDLEAVEEASNVEKRIIQWQTETPKKDPRWAYYDMEVNDSEHVWGNTLHSYCGLPAPQAWNTIRSVQCMVTRTQEMLCRRLPTYFTDAERKEQAQYFQKQRRRLTDDICATVPALLGHASPAFNSPCVLITAYAAVWPIFFAATCALERIGSGAHRILKGGGLPPAQMGSQAVAQALWLMGRLEYISKNIGLRWAEGILAILKGDFMDFSEDFGTVDDKKEARRYGKVERAQWVRKIEEARRDLIDEPGTFKAETEKNQGRPIWDGQAVGPYSQSLDPIRGSLHGFEV